MRQEPVIVSACLLGVCSRYDGTDALNASVVEELKYRAFIPVCPEQLGGLPTPRPRAEIYNCRGIDVVEGSGKVMDENGADVTKNFVRGAKEVLKIARITNAGLAFLKEKSPSCGVRQVYRNNEPVLGAGVTAALLRKEGLLIRGFD